MLTTFLMIPTAKKDKQIQESQKNKPVMPFKLNLKEIDIRFDVPSGSAFEDEMLILGKLVAPIFSKK